MMRLRRATLLVALSLLTSAATASAECAWVLWSFSSDVDKYGVDSAHATRQECSKAVGDVTTMLLLRYICLPDTVDPLGPKGK